MSVLPPRLRGLYLITPDDPDTARLLARVTPLLAAGPALLQYRNKGASPALRREQARALLHECRAAGVPLIVNDDWRLAGELGADGAHLGADDGDLAQARAALGDAVILGASCYDEPALARRAIVAGASYVAFGAFFPSPSKAATRRATPDLLRADLGAAVPRVAIGGIGIEPAADLAAAGADLVAVISGVFAAADPVAALHAYRRAIAAAHTPPATRAGISAGNER
ncbi:thiamine phosphate synthase [Arenimonas composti]|uniref:Thiamine-phosphate synthase n=1 Tax=Arenimonas composti TR7-09 = DSM 18010 TaxID=1121013 RepID=A0A091BC90_9GAMM|nr:thiamine phosphate synthase [Arenimonas composti]KFN49142.1 hypothetical protein P873_11855 [Arenimonas composti TR7-09 = DSM 18010]